MNRPLVAQKTVLDSILEWSIDRPTWQRDALRRIIAKGRLDADDHKELVELCKAGRNADLTSLKPIPLEKAHLPANPDLSAEITLVSVADVLGANNLAPGQVLNFESKGLTVIYGHNGAGKSGYARILKRACRARFPGKIEANVYDGQAPRSASANITFEIGGEAQPVEAWEDGPQPHARLSAVSVFDSDCASVHIRDKNEVAFRPFGLDVPDELANACVAVKELLLAEQKQLEKAQNPLFISAPWKATTAVGKALAGLTADTIPSKVVAAATLSPEETLRLEQLRDDLAKSPIKAAAEQTLKADNVRRIITAAKSVEAGSTDEGLDAVRKAVNDARTKRDAARIASEKAFDGEAVPGIGGEVWRELWESARRFSNKVAVPGQMFPPVIEETHCVLCLQPLQEDALNRMGRFEQFVLQDTAVQALQAEKAATSARTALSSIAMRTSSIKAALGEVALQDIELVRKTRRFIASARLRRYQLLRSLDERPEAIVPAAVASPIPALTEHEGALRKYGDELRKSANAEERNKLESELAELQDRSVLAGVLHTVLGEIRRLAEIRFIVTCIGDTNTHAITKVGNDIADTVITPKMRDRFQEEIVKLAAEKVRVEIVRSGGKFGSPLYQVRLFAKPEAKLHEVLSEGERTCVALAAFMTELATSAHNSALVFDDPVSSLDHRWRKKVAERLVSEVAQRQVIVFTHDLVFVNDLVDLGAQMKVPLRMTTLSRGLAGAGLVADGLPWKGQGVADRIDKLEKAARAAKQLFESNQEEEYEGAVSRIYNDLRASWERGLEEVAFSHVVMRHRDYINAKDLKKVSVLTDSDCDVYSIGYKKCCDIVDAHDPSGGRNAAPPPPDDLLKDIQALKDWTISLRVRQKALS